MIDVNGTRFHLLLTERDWLGSEPVPGVRWNPDVGAVELMDQLFVFPPRKSKGPLELSTRRGAGSDSYGNWFWIGPANDEFRFGPSAGSASQHFWSTADEAQPAPSGDFLPVTQARAASLALAGVAVTSDHYLVAGSVAPQGLLIFDLYGGGAPSTIEFPKGVDFAPFDLAPTASGGVVILDRIHMRYWKLNCRFGIVPLTATAKQTPREQDFETESGGKFYRTEDVEAHIRIESSAPVDAFDPVAIEALPNGDVFILDNVPALGYSIVRRYRGSQEIGHAALDPLAMTLSDDASTAEGLLGYDLAFLKAENATASSQGTVYVMSIEGEQVFAFAVSDADGLSLTLLPKYYPVRRFSGKALTAANGEVFYDFGDRWLPVVEQPRPRYTQEAAMVLAAFDGKLRDCVWHRLFLDACIPPGSGVMVESRAANTAELLNVAAWRPEPAWMLRPDGPEIPFYTPALQGSTDRTGTFELLFQDAVGRFMQLRLTLSGTGRNTPRLQALRAYYPRFSYLKQYLPAVYREDATSASFLDRFLANPEGILTTLEARIEQAQELFDPHTLGAAYLDWLASWLGATLDGAWSEGTRRLFIEHAHELFPQRGTPNGILRMLHLALDAQPGEALFQGCSCGCGQCSGGGAATPGFDIQLVESFLTRTLPEGAAFGSLEGAVMGTVASQGVAAQWTPQQGSPALDQIFRGWLADLYATVADLNAKWGTSFSGFDDPSLRFPGVEPGNAAQAADWLTFTETQFSFRYADAGAGDLALYRETLARKYLQPSTLNSEYALDAATALASFADVDTRLWPVLQRALPDNAAWLADWIAFVGLALPVARSAHRFVVLVPVGLNDSLATQAQKLQLAQRVAEAEKPAHTQVDVRLYWAMFRVGEARVGRETILGQGSRFTPTELGVSYLGSSYLAFGPPWNIATRMVVGRDQIQNEEKTV